MKKINVLHFICPTGLYGAEMWILALVNNCDRTRVNSQLAISHESSNQNIEICNRFNSLGFESRRIRMRGRFDPSAILKLVRLLRNEEIDIIHTHGYKADILGFLASRITGIKVISTPHGFENSKDLKLEFFVRVGCLALKHFDMVVPLSQQIQEDLIRHKVNGNKMKLIMNGLDLDEIEKTKKASARSKSNCEEKKIGYIGRLVERKNVLDLIRAFDILNKEHKNVRLIIIGDGPLREKLEQRVKSLESSAKVKFLGYKSNRLSLMKELDLFCMTSLSEGIPRAMMEAMALEIPVAAYRIPGVDKLIIHKKTGLLTEVGDIENLKTCLKKLLFNQKLAKELARDARNHIMNQFSAKRMAVEYANLYQKILS